ncbi:MAG: carboxynorspermidine decarboxylase [Elusimicrobiota bacterium]|jgi:carboxynorspermidine decarboxylase|nr:carboxynorspermidine decarboxylase [Elusimicrobiota bacterium]
MNKIQTPYYLIDEKALLKNMKKIEYVRKNSGAKSLLALKCFSSWAVFPLMSKYMDGTTSSSLYEARLGFEKFGKETHAFSVAYSDSDIEQLKKFSDKIIFNSISQLEKYHKSIISDAKKNKSKTIPKIGLRINPSISYSHFDLADPARKYSRLGEISLKKVMSVLDKISGAMFHYNCENEDFSAFEDSLDIISKKYEKVLEKIDWISFGGGISFTKDNYPLDKFCAALKKFSEKFKLQIFLEPGDASITQSAKLITTVLDIVKNVKTTAIVDASVEAHMLDLLIYKQRAKIDELSGANEYILAGKSCLAGDIFGTYKIKRELKVGSIIEFCDAAGYTMVKKNWFNGLNTPSIAVKRLNGKIELIKEFTYKDFADSVS